MLIRAPAARGLATSIALLVLAFVVEVAVTTAATSTVPSGYRFTGTVENGRGVSTRYVARGDGIRFVFFDALSQGRRSMPYTLCIGRPSQAPVRCWNRTARYGVGQVAFSFELPRNVPLGPLTARWLVSGRAVASWRFLYVRGGG